MAKPMQDAAASFERLAADPSPLLAGRGQLFSDEMLEPPDADLQPIIDELASDDALRTNVARFITAGLTKGLPQLLKHTAEYQPGGVAAVSTPEARAAAAALPCSSSSSVMCATPWKRLCPLAALKADKATTPN